MKYAEVKVSDVCAARERRAFIRQKMLRDHKAPVVTLSMNIAGPVKNSEAIEFLFRGALEKLRGQLSAAPLEEAVFTEFTGCEAILCVDLKAEDLKKTAMRLEDELPHGRLLDIDVTDTDGNQLNRTEERGCLICGRKGKDCARSRRHPLSELKQKTDDILFGYAAERISDFAVSSLIEEAELSPKPGLVDSINSGAHSDMNLALMKKSALALKDYYRDMVLLGIRGADEALLRERGLKAEEEMYKATGGVNTHKGNIFGLGILCCAAGCFISGRGPLRRAASDTAKALENSRPHVQSHGTAMLEKYGIPGASSEASEGFPAAFEASQRLSEGSDPLRVFCGIMASVKDSNLYWRGGGEGAELAAGTAKQALLLEDSELAAFLAKADQSFTERNLSPGGCADILAQAMFIRTLKAYFGPDL